MSVHRHRADRGRPALGSPRRPWPLAEVVRVLRPIAAALDYAHEHGIVHGDIRPGMVLVTPDGTPILGGFGLSAHLPPPADARRRSRPASVIAHPSRRSPPARSATVADSPSSPTKCSPASGRRRGRAHRGRALPPAQLGSPLLAPPVEQTLLRELAGEPSGRYPTASAFVADLAATPTPRTGTEPASVPPPPNGAVVVDPSRRRLAILGTRIGHGSPARPGRHLHPRVRELALGRVATVRVPVQ